MIHVVLPTGAAQREPRPIPCLDGNSASFSRGSILGKMRVPARSPHIWTNTTSTGTSCPPAATTADRTASDFELLALPNNISFDIPTLAPLRATRRTRARRSLCRRFS